MMNEKQLLVISDSPMWNNENGEVQIFEPTLKEIEKIQASHFDAVTWIGFEQQNQQRKDGCPTNHAIFPVLLPAAGGKTVMGKLKQLSYLPFYLMVIVKHILKNQYIHTRGPSMPALIGVLLSFVWRKRIYWHKFAGNWVQANPPLSYAIQRALLKKANHTKVTVNGKWTDNHPHIKPFENPCIEKHDLEAGEAALKQKAYSPPWTLCFVGRIEEAKGVKILLNTIFALTDSAIIKWVHFIGDGAEKKYWENWANARRLPVTFHGSLNGEALRQFYKDCQLLLLPSRASEGFPKVIAEGAAYGCIPVVSAISSIQQYVADQKNGLIIEPLSVEQLQKILLDARKAPETLKQIAQKGPELAEQFTFTKFNGRLKKEVFQFE